MSSTIPEEDNVYYCRSCHSLLILVDDSMSYGSWDGCYCGKCHSTDIGVCSYDEWEEEEKRRAAKKRELEWRK